MYSIEKSRDRKPAVGSGGDVRTGARRGGRDACTRPRRTMRRTCPRPVTLLPNTHRNRSTTPYCTLSSTNYMSQKKSIRVGRPIPPTIVEQSEQSERPRKSKNPTRPRSNRRAADHRRAARPICPSLAKRELADASVITSGFHRLD